MRRVITSVAFDLKFDVSDTPPNIRIDFADIDDAGRESHAGTDIVDDEAAAMWLQINSGVPLLDAANNAIDVRAKHVSEPGTVAALIGAASEAQKQARNACEARENAERACEALRREIAALEALRLELGAP